jgi:hypothetical protein
MKTLTITQARKNLGQLCNEAGRGKMVGIISGHQIFQLKPVQVVAWDDTYVAKEYGVTPDEMDKFVAHADGEQVVYTANGGKTINGLVSGPLNNLAAGNYAVCVRSYTATTAIASYHLTVAIVPSM